jgi:ribosomal protein S18 acetylase RimI-like enzyme
MRGRFIRAVGNRAVQTSPGRPEFADLLAWPFAAEPFYEAQVLRLLKEDIPHRVTYGFCITWIYVDPTGSKVAFSTLDVCREYKDLAGGVPHFYIPVLAVHPEFQGKGHGRSIVEHLIAEAALMAHTCPSDLLFLDVYTANGKAISLYEKFGFVTLNPDCPISDPQANNETYLIMAKRVDITPG